MPQLTAKLLSSREFATLGWAVPASDVPLQALTSLPIGGREARQAAACFPLVLRAAKDQPFELCALLGAAGSRVFSQDTLAYQPFALRYFPFVAQGALPSAAPDAKTVWRLGVYCDDRWLRADGHAFFGPDGKMSDGTQKIADMFKGACQDFDRARLMAQELDAAGVLTPLRLGHPNLCVIDEAALLRLEADALCALNASGALQLAYAMRVSTAHLSRLDLTPARLSHSAQAADPADGAEGSDAFLDAILDDWEAGHD